MSQASPAPQEQDRYPYSAIVDRKPLRWPNGARVAVWVIPNIEHFLFDRPSTSVTPVTASLVPDVLNYSWRDYGVRVGIWRMMDVMEKHGVKGTVALNSDVCRHYPRIIEGGKQLGWEWMGHGNNNSTLINRQSEDEEKQLIKTSSIPSRRAPDSSRAAGSAPRSANPIARSIFWPKTAFNTLAIGSTTSNPTRCG